MIQVDLSKIIIDEKRQDQVIVLKEKDGDRQFPIVIGFLEASSIKMKLSDMQVPRPMTHDLIINILKGIDSKVERLVIDKLVANTFHAKLEIRTPDRQLKTIDCRPSDGVALAVRDHSPIYVDEEVLKKASIFKI